MANSSSDLDFSLVSSGAAAFRLLRAVTASRPVITAAAIKNANESFLYTFDDDEVPGQQIALMEDEKEKRAPAAGTFSCATDDDDDQEPEELLYMTMLTGNLESDAKAAEVATNGCRQIRTLQFTAAIRPQCVMSDA